VAVRTLRGYDNNNNNNIKYDNNDTIESEGDEHYSCGVGGDDGGGSVVIYYIYRLSDWCQQLVDVATVVGAGAVDERVLCVLRAAFRQARREVCG